jgi:hypothetical protein
MLSALPLTHFVLSSIKAAKVALQVRGKVGEFVESLPAGVIKDFVGVVPS